MNSALKSAATLTEPQQYATPPCSHFGICGGCQLQHLAYSTQLEQKSAKLRELLSAAKLATNKLPEIKLHASPPLAYRNRIRLTLRELGGQLRAGYLGKLESIEDHEDAVIPSEAALEESGEVEGPPHLNLSGNDAYLSFVPITECPIAAPILWRAAEAFLPLAGSAPWLRAAGLTPDQLELFTTADESRLQLTLYLRTAQKNPPAKLSADFTALCESLRSQIPELAGAGIALLPPASRSRRTEQARPGPTWGSPGLNYAVPQLASRTALEPRTPNLESDLTYWVPRGAFFQVNRFLLPELVALVANAALASRDRALAWDLYAGVGLFSRALARAFAEVTAVEIAEPAAAALAQTTLPNLRAVKSTALDFLRAAVLQRDRPSLAVLDPPRTGLGPEICSLLARVAAPTLVYVSCSPHALAADLKALTTLSVSGYSVAEFHLFDLFPQTSHIETVAILTYTS